jgi:hypothetical protein
MANKKLNQLVTKPSIASGDLFPIADATTGQLYKTTISDLGTAIGSGVSSVNGLVGAVVLDTDDIQELASPVNKWYTDLRARAALSAGSGISYSSSTGVIASTITQYTDALARAAISLTTTGSNGSATYNSTTGVLNVPAYTLSGLGGQPLAGNLTALAGLSYSSLGFIKMTGVGTLALDTNTYALDSAVVHLSGTETISGLKTITNNLIIRPVSGYNAYFQSSLSAMRLNFVDDSLTTNVSGAFRALDYSFQCNSTVAFTINTSAEAQFYSSVTATSFIKSSGTSSQFLKADGSVDSNTYLTTSSASTTYLSLAGGTLTGVLNGTSAIFSSTLKNRTSLEITATSTSAVTSSILIGTNASGLYGSSIKANSNYGTNNSTDLIFQVSNAGTALTAANFSNLGAFTLGSISGQGTGSFFAATATIGNFTPIADALLPVQINAIATTGQAYFAANNGGTYGLLIGYDNVNGIARIRNVSNTSLTLETNNTKKLEITNSGTAIFEGLIDGKNGIYQRNAAATIASNTFETYNGGATELKFNFPSAGSVAFNNGTTRLNITSGGNILVNTTSDNGIKFQVIGDTYASGYVYFKNQASSNNFAIYGSTNILVYNSAVGNIASINASTGIYTPTSDKNKKKDFEVSNIGLNEVMQLKPTLYRMKTDDSNGIKELGFIAQEVKDYIPNAYVESGDFIGLNFNPIVAALTKAVQELKAELDTLKNK